MGGRFETESVAELARNTQSRRPPTRLAPDRRRGASCRRCPSGRSSGCRAVLACRGDPHVLHRLALQDPAEVHLARLLPVGAVPSVDHDRPVPCPDELPVEHQAGRAPAMVLALRGHPTWERPEQAGGELAPLAGEGTVQGGGISVECDEQSVDYRSIATRVTPPSLGPPRSPVRTAARPIPIWRRSFRSTRPALVHPRQGIPMLACLPSPLATSPRRATVCTACTAREP
jgi:hypothetical protein